MKLNIGSYFKTGTRFEIPAFQRGYKWSVKPENKKSSVEVFCDSLIGAFNNNSREYFIEAVTIVQANENDPIILVDGQQRTTTLFLLFVALKEFAFVENVLLNYAVRKDSHYYLQNLICKQKFSIEDEDIQDIFYFKEALRTIEEKLKTINKSQQEFITFLKEKVWLLLNKIPANRAVNRFIALNGLKAIMKDEELIKSDLLIKSSRMDDKICDSNFSEKERFAIEWKINEDRSRLARNWDKWLYWWNQFDVKNYYGTNNHHPLYYLLVTFWNINKGENDGQFSFENFKNAFISDSKDAKNNFEKLRKLQKSFEDLYCDYVPYNFLGLILKTSNDKEKAIQYFLDFRIENKLTFEKYAKWSLVSATHLEIINDAKVRNEETEQEILAREKKLTNALDLINEKYVYWDENGIEFGDGRKEYAYRFLMLLNLLEDNKLKRKFDFTIWNHRSLEHIYPKSKQNEMDFSKEGFEEGSIHCIGNLVLLYGDNNSEFGAKDFVDKKQVYFNTEHNVGFKSRHLLHSLSVFANKDWEENEIIINKKNIVKRLKQILWTL